MGVVEKLGTAVKKIVAKPSKVDLIAAVMQAEAAVDEAAKAVQRKRDEFTLAFDELADSKDELAIRRFQQEITDLENVRIRATEELEMRRGRVERSTEREAQEAQGRVISEFERLGQLAFNRATLLRDAQEALAEELTEYTAICVQLQRFADEMLVQSKHARLQFATPQMQAALVRVPTRVHAEDFVALFSRDGIANLFMQDMSVFTDGLIPLRSFGDLYGISQGPRFDRRVKESLVMLRRMLQENGVHMPPPPVAA